MTFIPFDNMKSLALWELGHNLVYLSWDSTRGCRLTRSQQNGTTALVGCTQDPSRVAVSIKGGEPHAVLISVGSLARGPVASPRAVPKAGTATVEELRTIVSETHVTQGSSQYNEDNSGWGLRLSSYLLSSYLLQSLELLAASGLGSGLC